MRKEETFLLVLKKLLVGLHEVNRFKPGKVLPEKGGNESQVDAWKYKSGFIDGGNAILFELGLDPEE
jgi:hypothetical protein